MFSSSLKDNEIDGICNILSLSLYKNTKVNLLSSGELKKLELCRLIIEQRKLWVLDEPYLGLDDSAKELINETFKNHISNGGMIFFSSHYQPELQNIDTIKLENYANN